MKISKLHRIAVLAVVAVLPAGCAVPAPTEPPTALPTPRPTETPTEERSSATRSREGPITIAFVPSYMGNPYFDTANQGAQEAAAELGIEVTYTGPETADPVGEVAEQIQLINALIAQGVDGLAISATDTDALVPVGWGAIDQGIPVVSWGSAIAEWGRIIHINSVNLEGLWRVQIEIASRLAGGEGQIAVLSGVSEATANTWTDFFWPMKEILEEDDYQGLELVDIVTVGDEDEPGYNEALGLMTTYPDLEVIIVPDNYVVYAAAAARAVQDRGKIGQVFVTGLGTPNWMREYVKSGAAPEFVLWNPVDLGYLTIYASYHLVMDDIAGKPGDTFDAGRLGSYTILDNGTVLLGAPYIFNADNIDDFDF